MKLLWTIICVINNNEFTSKRSSYGSSEMNVRVDPKIGWSSNGNIVIKISLVLQSEVRQQMQKIFPLYEILPFYHRSCAPFCFICTENQCLVFMSDSSRTKTAPRLRYLLDSGVSTQKPEESRAIYSSQMTPS